MQLIKIFLLSILTLIFTGNVFATDPPIQLYDEGVLQGTIFRINCVGDGIVCTRSGITGIITVGAVAPITGQLQFISSDLTFNGSNLTFNP